jgi:hypothetical protein
MNYKPMRRFAYFSASFALVAAVSSLTAAAQSGSFIVAQHGKSVGTAEFNVATAPNGYSSTSTVRITMQGLNYSLSKTESLSSANHLRHEQLSATVNGSAVNVTATPDAAQILLNVSANGKSSTARLALHPDAVFLPDFDPGALETLLTLGVAHNNRGLWAIIPKQTRAADGSTQAGSIHSVVLATYADEKGTLDGKAVAVHHQVMTIAGAKSDLFSGPENQLLQAELPQQGFALVRKGFVLTPPARPMAPPTAPQAPAAAPAAAPKPPVAPPTQQ